MLVDIDPQANATVTFLTTDFTFGPTEDVGSSGIWVKLDKTGTTTTTTTATATATFIQRSRVCS